LGVIALFVVALLCSAFWYGTRLPQSVKHTESLVLPLSHSAAWEKIRNVERYPSWRPWIKSIQVTTQDSDGVTNWTENRAHGSEKFRILGSSIPDTLRVEYTPHSKNFRTTWTWSLETVPPDSTRIELTTQHQLVAPLYRIAVILLHIQPEGTQSLLQALVK
jgi:ribosome-associated toxin RatA of RatAB toxin-antitoxin module